MRNQLSYFFTGRVLFLFCLLLIHFYSFSQGGVWTTLPDFPGTSRYAATGFAINGKGYVVTGYHSNGPVLLNDTWEFDPADSSWAQKAPFPGGSRWYCSSFAVNGKGYVGMGSTTTDFWEFDPVQDTWTQKNNFPGLARAEAVAFSIGNKAYMGLGAPYGTSAFMQDFWEYNALTDTWTQLANFPGGPRGFAVSFVIGQKAYVGTGDSPGFNVYNNDLWEFNPLSNTWTQKQNMPVKRTQAVAFSIGNFGYIGMGTSINGQFVFPQDNWRFNPLTNQWDSVPALPFYKWCLPVTFTFGNSAYVATGFPAESTVFKFSVKQDYITSVPANGTFSAWKIYPNPSPGEFHFISPQGATGEAVLKVTNTQGQMVYEKKIVLRDTGLLQRLDLRFCPKGIYFLEIGTGAQYQFSKLIVD